MGLFTIITLGWEVDVKSIQVCSDGTFNTTSVSKQLRRNARFNITCDWFCQVGFIFCLYLENSAINCNKFDKDLHIYAFIYVRPPDRTHDPCVANSILHQGQQRCRPRNTSCLAKYRSPHGHLCFVSIWLKFSVASKFRRPLQREKTPPDSQQTCSSSSTSLKTLLCKAWSEISHGLAGTKRKICAAGVGRRGCAYMRVCVWVCN